MTRNWAVWYIFHLQDPDSPTYWMEMLKIMSETLRIGLVVSDMFVPGCPIAHLNDGFVAQTGEAFVPFQ